jgi:D-alanine-D-alanine ligase
MMQKDKLRIAVLMGGPSAEYEVSLKTGQNVMENLDRKKYIPKKIVISKEGRWPISPKEIKKKFDVVFNAMHGEYGEDGQVQKILDKYKIRYTGSGVKASELGMDKEKSYKIFRKAGLKVPDFKVINIGPEFNFKLDVKYPVVVKPNDRGSSKGVTIVEKFQDLIHALNIAAQFSPMVMLQEYIRGREFSCGVLEINGKAKALPPTEIRPVHGKFFDYEAKYTSGKSQEITPPKLPKDVIKKIQQVALKAHQAIKASGYSRTDMIMEAKSEKRKTENIYVLEINTLPGMTETSILPQEAKVDGIDFPRLLDLIIESAL